MLEETEEESMTEYQSIDSLMEGKAPGSVELVSSGETRFKPYFRSATVWHGSDSTGDHISWDAETSYWKPYVKPKAKRKIKLYRAISNTSQGIVLGPWVEWKETSLLILSYEEREIDIDE